MLRESLSKAMGAAFEDVDRILSVDDGQLRFILRRPAPFQSKLSRQQSQKSAGNDVGTGAYIPAGTSELKANTSYYLGRPTIDRILVTSYPSVRAAWAELLRGNLDMLFEVNADALDSLQSSSDVALFSFIRHYQYLLMFGPHAPVFQSAEIRRELNAAIDRNALLRDGLNGHGVVSSGPVPPRHWALGSDAPKFGFDAKLAASLQARNSIHVPRLRGLRVRAPRIGPQASARCRLSGHAHSGAPRRIRLIQAMAKNDFEAILMDSISGPSLFRCTSAGTREDPSR